jgi:glutamate-5-semialdehyde dehydrogenase
MSHAPADLEMVKRIVVNAKMRRTGICGAAETLLCIDRVPTGTHAASARSARRGGCEIRGDDGCARPSIRSPSPPSETDWHDRVSRRDHLGRRRRWA